MRQKHGRLKNSIKISPNHPAVLKIDYEFKNASPNCSPRPCVSEKKQDATLWVKSEGQKRVGLPLPYAYGYL
ncbi:hypothetical protein ACIG5E_34850 [Kitasatospora sp. NPDC053057]|uniref:hypothetical protein n=1 Tax=Kitasatospora sp. NPDC053057 TaxID=3364062 RepID=UPI0037C7DDF9